MHALSRSLLALLFSSSVVTACATPETSAPVLSENGAPSQNIRGIWSSSEKGWILEIEETGISRWQDTKAACYRSPASDATTPLMGQLEYQLYRISRDKQKAYFQYLPGDATASFTKLDALPDRCKTDQQYSPVKLFDIFVVTMSEHYAFFDERNVDWSSLVQQERVNLREAMSEAELWTVFSRMLAPLGDSHTKMVGLVDGDPARIQFGLGTTLLEVRNGMTEGQWIPELVDQLMTDVLDPGAQLVDDRVIIGEIDGRIGYIQIFTMGGFRNDHPPGTIEWSVAELRRLDDILDDALSQFQNHDAIILDLSNNRGGYDAVTRAIASRFTDEPFVGYRVSVPGYPEADKEYVISPHDGLRYDGPVFLMTSDVTVSGGEITTLMLRELDQVTLVGTPTRGAFSTPLAKPLPNGWYLELSNEVFSSADGTVFEGRGIPPDIEIDIYPTDAPVAGHKAAIEFIVSLIDAGDITR